MKNILLGIFLCACTLGYSQALETGSNIVEKEVIQQNNTAFSIKANYKIQDNQIAELTTIISESLGQSLSATRPIWSVKTETENYSVKIMNRGVFIRAKDTSAAQNTAALISVMNENVKTYLGK